MGRNAMKRALIAAVLSVGLIVLSGPWSVAVGDEDDDHKKSDVTLFDGTNPATEASPDGGAECTVKGAATFYVAVTAHSSGPSGFVRATFADGDFVQFPIAANGSFSFSQSIGGTENSDNPIKISNGGNVNGAPLVGWASSPCKKVFCRGSNSNDVA